MQLRNFNEEEWILFLLTSGLVVFIVGYNYLRGYREFWSPLTIIALVYAYYCCLGPYEAVLTGNTFDRLQNMRNYYPSAFLGALISLASYVVGFVFHGRTGGQNIAPTITHEQIFYLGRNIFLLGFILFTISTGGQVTKLINPLDAEYISQAGGTFANYLALSLNFVIPAIALLFTYFLITRKGFWWFVIPFIVSIGLFTTLGFRYRIVLLLASCSIVFFYYRGKRPNLILLVAGFISLITIMGLINEARRYGTGLDSKRLESATTESAYRSGLEEAGIFQTSGAVIDLVPQRYPYVGIQPLVSTLLFPIPSKWMTDKNSAQYLFEALDVIYGKKYSKGAAILAFGEYYLAFGWAGIVIGCFITGWFLRRLWNWFLFNSQNPLVIAAYSVFTSFIYVIISRGYLPQITYLFFFTVFPIFVAIRYVTRTPK
jgi:hypothetical protein